jgi:hypothetical protein
MMLSAMPHTATPSGPILDVGDDACDDACDDAHAVTPLETVRHLSSEKKLST